MVHPLGFSAMFMAGGKFYCFQPFVLESQANLLTNLAGWHYVHHKGQRNVGVEVEDDSVDKVENSHG